MYDLITSTNCDHYERFRSKNFTIAGRTDEDPTLLRKKALEMQMKSDEDSLRKRFAEQVRTEESRFKVWEQKVFVSDIS